MKNFVSFIFLIVIYNTRLTFCSDNIFNGNLKGFSFPNNYNDKHIGNIGEILRNKKFDYVIGYNGSGIFGREDNKFAFDEGNPDIHGIIKRPCQAYDTFCIRKFFAEHSKCKISGSRLPDPFFRAQSTFHYPSANISATNLNQMYGGLNNARVQEFYFNEVTDNLVITFNFDAVSVRCNDTNIKYYLRGREPEVTRDFGNTVFVQITITLIIPGLDNLRLDRAEIHTYYTNSGNTIFPFAAGPRLGLSSDPEVVAMFTYFVTAGVPVEQLEELSTEGVFIGTNYLQYNICDFGLKVL